MRKFRLMTVTVLPKTVAALSLPGRWAAGVATLAIGLYSFLMLYSLPLPIADAARAQHVVGDGDRGAAETADAVDDQPVDHRALALGFRARQIHDRPGIARDHDLKQLMRLILNSRAYQLSSATTPANATDQRFHSHYLARRLSAEVPSTGNWDTYQSLPLGRVVLEPGQRRVVVRPERTPRGALVDLKSVRLRAVK